MPVEGMDGGCDCGGVRFRMTSKPMFVHCCHCRWCQRETGTAFALNALIETTHVVLLKGEPEAVAVPSASGNGQTIFRCPACRIAVWSNYGRRGDKLRFIRVGTLDNPDACPPDVQIWTSSKQFWVMLPPGVPTFTEYYKWAELWPAKSLARAKALFG